jgi:cathepsin C
MVYDEGFDFSFGEKDSNNYATYFVFSKYGPNDFKKKGVKSKWASYCYASLIGWYQVGNKYGCFYGVKKGKTGDEVTNGEASNKQVVVEGSMTSKTFLQKNEKGNLHNPPEVRFMESKFSEKLLLNANFKDHTKVVERINASNLTWKAAVYEEFEGKTIEQLNKLAGRKKSRTGFITDFHLKNNHNSLFDKMTFQESNERNSYSWKNSKKNKSRNSLPRDFDWTKYVGPAKSQVSTSNNF